MSSAPPPVPYRRERGRRSRRVRLRRWGVAVVAGAALFAMGVALGEALHDNPKPGGTRTLVRTLTPLPLAPARETVTVTVEGR